MQVWRQLYCLVHAQTLTTVAVNVFGVAGNECIAGEEDTA